MLQKTHMPGFCRWWVLKGWGTLAAPDKLGTAGCQWWGQAWRTRAGPVLSLPPCPRAGAWDGPLWEGSEVGRDGHRGKTELCWAGQGWTWVKTKLGRAGGDTAVNPWGLLCCSDVGHGNVPGPWCSFLCNGRKGTAFFNSLCQSLLCSGCYFLQPTLPPPFFSAHMSDYLVWETSDSLLYDSDVWHFLPPSVKKKTTRKES